TGSKSVIGAMRDHTAEGDPAIGIEIDKILLRWAADHSAENANALWIFAIRHAPDEVINNSVHSPVGLNRHGIGRGGHSHPRTKLLAEGLLKSFETIQFDSELPPRRPLQ